MWKLILILLASLGFGLSQPRSREIILDVAAPAMNPIHRFITNRELARIASELEAFQDDGETIPARQEDFDRWLNRTFDEEARRMDGWGHRYLFKVGISNYTISSPGPDGTPGTEDDLSVEGVRVTQRSR